MTTDNTGKFTGLGEVYARSRPGYPAELLDLLAARIGGVDAAAAERPDAGAPDAGTSAAESTAAEVPETGHAGAAVVADIGAGTGKLTAELLARGWRVSAVEPNDDMRDALVARLADDERLTVVGAPAEATRLPDASVNLVTVAQAFHWFDIPSFRAECRRILRPGGQIALIWNFRRRGEASVEAVAEAFRARVGGFVALTLAEEITDADLTEFYGGTHFQRFAFDNDEEIGWETFRERHLSTSYAPKEGDPAREPLTADLERIFDEYAVDGRYTFPNSTHVLLGELRG
ncbi:class I SAM-dependent methyltransferase [Brevibacterium jeotgali]|uniref:Methyltransferase domain-containing protein n=1 Tax=Brevibacterium jeotgali TaxID=1262550 RepID=A0A2H1L476_9MICO|nr:class I SAM-dependent methyltransferase [Brevibacterium jeotgali]TWC01823.1 methyltransferase family protein [Brevibacterium jeotgali]SMY11570.1 Methyltransferase domain-containing protein [Brevibacterium jeotgali]